MKKTDKRFDEPAAATSLREAIHLARIQEAETLDRSVGRRSSELARLEVLHAAVEHVFKDIPMADDRFALSLVPSKPARLWIDMLSYIAMDASGEIYRMIRNEGEGRIVLAETEDVGVMAGRITEYVAHEIVKRERAAAGVTYDAPHKPLARRASMGRLVLAFIIGLLTGIAGLMAVGWQITQ